jgi:hypothetical protein
MKAIKLFFAVITGLLAVVQLPKLFASFQGRSDLSFSYHMGSLVGILFLAAISVALFRSASSQ